MSLDPVPATGNARTPDMRADPVKDFYTSHPYPPPVANLDRARDEWQDENRHRAEYHLLWPATSYRADLDILVAGCGTWQAAKYALCRPDARVVGVDVSTTSLEHTDRLKRQYNLTNLELHELAIEAVARLEHRFDLIVCSGVLHHLVDPDAGLRALRSVLRSDGALYLMVYAPYGRTGISLLREYCRRLGIKPSEGEVRDLVAVLNALPQHHPLITILRGSRDAGNADALADALLNPRERSYSVPEIFDSLEQNGLTLRRWYWQALYMPQCGSLAATPHASRLAALPERDQYAALELWRGTMASHSFVACRSDSNAEQLKVHFDDEDWQRFVPIRRPSTVCVQKSVTAGAVAVLLNRNHCYPDLILPIGAGEKRMFDAIDGHRTIGQVAGNGSDGGASARARAFFEKLWRYDQVVFDVSMAGRSIT